MERKKNRKYRALNIFDLYSIGKEVIQITGERVKNKSKNNG